MNVLANKMYIIVEGECTMHFNRYGSNNAIGNVNANANGGIMSNRGSSSKSNKKSKGIGLSDDNSESSPGSGVAVNSTSGNRNSSVGSENRYSMDSETVIARFGPGCVFGESSIFKDLKHDWHVVIRSPTLKTYCIHRNDWYLINNVDYNNSSNGSNVYPVVSEKIKRTFYGEAKFKMNYYTSRAATLAKKFGMSGNSQSSSESGNNSQRNDHANKRRLGFQENNYVYYTVDEISDCPA